MVKDRNQSISIKPAINKLNLSDSKEIGNYKRLIRKFNNTESSDRGIYYFSRPIFDDLKKYAIIQSDFGHSWLGGGGGMELYHFENDNWKSVGYISIWKY